MSDTPNSSLADISQLEALLREGIKRIAAAQTDLPGAQDPLTEALQMSEEQTMAALEAIERGQEAVAQIRQTNGAFIDTQLAIIEDSFSRIMASQQAQDLSGQRLKKAITLLRAVDERLSDTLSELQSASGIEAPAEGDGKSAAKDGKTYAQADVDDLLAELGL